MTRLSALALAALIALAGPALADANLEKQMLVATGKAFVKMIFADAAAARAECEAGKALLTAKTPKYLAAYSEECFALAAAPAGPSNEQPRCPYYLRAIDIWRASPPPMTDDEDAAIKRAGRLKDWKEFAAKNCGAPAEPARTDMGPIAPIAAGSRLATQEGISYTVPDGWTVRGFDDVAGFAMLTHASRNNDLRIARVSLKNKMDYTDKTALPSGHVLEWKYIEFIPKSGMYVMYGRANLTGAYVEFGLVPNKDAPSGAGVDKDFALDTLKQIADSAKIDGKRACIGNCGPGKLEAP